MSKGDDSTRNPDASGATDGLRKHWRQALHSKDRLTRVRLETLLESLANAALAATDKTHSPEDGDEI